MATSNPNDEYEFRAFKNRSNSKDSSKRRSYNNSRQNIDSKNISRAQTSITINTTRTSRTNKSNDLDPKSPGIHKKKIQALKNKTKRFDDQSFERFIGNIKDRHNNSVFEDKIKDKLIDSRMLPNSIKHYKSKVQTRCLDKYDNTVSDWHLQQKNINNILKRPSTAMTLMNAGKYYNTK